MKELRYLNRYFVKYKWRLLMGFIFIILTNIFAVYSPQVIKEGIGFLRSADEQYYAPLAAEKEQNPDFNKDEFFESADLVLPQSLQWIADTFGVNSSQMQGIDTFQGFLKALAAVAILLGILYLLVYVIKGIFLFFTRQTIIVMSRLIEYDLKNDIYDQYQRLDAAFYKRNNTGDLMNRISEDVSKVRMYLGPAVMYTLNLAVMIILIVSVMLSIDVELTLYALTPLPFMSVLVFMISKRINRQSEMTQKQQSKISTMVQENISGIRVLKAYNRQVQSLSKFEEECADYKEKTLGLVKIEALFMPIIVLLVGLSTILTIYIGGMKVANGQLAVETIFQFVFYVNMLTWPFASVGWVTSLVQRAEASQRRINEFLKAKPDIENYAKTTLREGIGGKIVFENVHFTYPDSGVQALRGVDFTVEKGQTLAIIGRTGTGKSTLANLVSRLYEPTQGRILIDDKVNTEHHLSQLRSAIGYVPQEVFLFSDSIANNIAFGMDKTDRVQVEQAARDADIHSNIQGFPDGYDTKLGERGINLSGGQKQRISIARAIIKHPSILIFDDCLSAVDTETEETILRNLNRIMKGKTSITISHRVSTIKHADQIVVLEEGVVAEKGSHQELLDIPNGIYANLYQKQLLEENVA